MNRFSLLRVFAVGIWLLSLSWLSAAPQDVLAPSVSSRTNEDPIQVLADWTVKEASAVGCNPGDCRILVTNFRMPEDVDEVVGVQLGDELSEKISETQKQVLTINRDLFKSYMETGHSSSEILKSVQSMSAVAHQLGAGALITANAMRLQGDTFRILVWLQNADDKSRAVTTDIVINGVAPGKSPVAASNFKIGAARPECIYMPNPPYSNEARKAKFSGAVRIDAVILPDGTIAGIRILNSPGLGLDDNIVKTMRGWKCKPVSTEKGPVPTRVHFEINFRLYP